MIITFPLRADPGASDKAAFLGKVNTPEGKSGHKKAAPADYRTACLQYGAEFRRYFFNGRFVLCAGLN